MLSDYSIIKAILGIIISLRIFACVNYVAAEQNALLPIPLQVNSDERKVALGEALFNDPILSGNKKISCSSCHFLNDGGDDNQQFPMNNLKTNRFINTPTVFNVSYNFKLTWSSAVSPLEKFYGVNLFGKNTMDNNWPSLIKSLNTQSKYVTQFQQIYGTHIKQENVLDAMLAFQASLTTPNARFDQYLRGDQTAINSSEKRGYRLF